MKIIIPIKQVPETKNVQMDIETGTVIRQGIQSIINPLDLYSIELALSLKEKHNANVTAISMGPPKASQALREAIAMGADDAILLSDRTFGGSDTFATSLVLSQAIKKIGDYDLIICGERATDGDTGQVGPGIAAFLNLPAITYISKVNSIAPHESEFVRMVEDGYEVLTSKLPLVITVVKEVSDPRLPTLRGKQKAKKIDIPIWDHKILNINPDAVGLKGSPTRVVNISKPKVTRNCDMLTVKDDATLDHAIDQFNSYLTAKELL